MNEPEFRHSYVAGDLAEYLAISAGSTKGATVAILTFRLYDASASPLNLLISRPQLERLKEDISFLLEQSPSLKDGPSPEVWLAELEANRDRLG